MAKTEAQILLDAYESVRNLTKFYISKLTDKNIHTQYIIKGAKLNSAYWLVTHLAWTERFLLLQGIGGTDMEEHWLDEYGFGSHPEDIKTKPPFEEILKLLDDLHAKAINIIAPLTDEQLDEQNHIEANFGGKTDKRALLKHAIRHEPMHVGQLSWILKANNMKVV